MEAARPASTLGLCRNRVRKSWMLPAPPEAITGTDTASRELKSAVEEVINQLDAGQIRVAEKKDGTWVTNEWVKKAVLLYFRAMPNYDLPVPGTAFYDKVPLKFNGYTPDQFKEAEIRVVPHAIVRKGAYISKHAAHEWQSRPPDAHQCRLFVRKLPFPQG